MTKKTTFFLSILLILTMLPLGAASASSAESTKSASVEYTVQPGDSFWKIAALRGIKLSNLLAANPLVKDPTQIEAGQKLITPDPAQAVVHNWLEPSGGAYPDITAAKNLWVDVSIADQRVYIKDGEKTLYTMVASTGIVGKETPKGTFTIEPERGKWFFAQRFQQGAHYWVSFLGHGKFLFHSVPMDKLGNVIPEEALKLGKTASHGCVRLSVADAKWMFNNIPTGAKVVIRD